MRLLAPMCSRSLWRTAFGRHGKDAQLWAQLLALTLGALGLVAAEDQGFKLVLAFLADVFKNRHDVAPVELTAPIRINLRELRKLYCSQTGR